MNGDGNVGALKPDSVADAAYLRLRVADSKHR